MKLIVRPNLPKLEITRTLSAAADEVVDEVVNGNITLSRSNLANGYLTAQAEGVNGTLEDVGGSSVLDLGNYPPTLERSGPGIARVQVSTPKGVLTRELSMETLSEASTTTFKTFPAGTPGKFYLDLVDTAVAVAGITPDLDFFDATSYSASLDFNPGCWLAAYKAALTCVPIAHLNGSFSGGGAAITKRHVLTGHHFTGHGSQTSFTFIGSDGVHVTKSVIGQCPSSNPGNGNFDNQGGYDTLGKYDLHLYTLDSDLPDEVTPCPIVSMSTANEDWLYPLDLFSNIAACYPGFALDQNRKGRIAWWQSNESYEFTSSLGGGIEGTNSNFIAGLVRINGNNYGVNVASRWLNRAPWANVDTPYYDLDLLWEPRGGDSGSDMFWPTSSSEVALVGLITSISDMGSSGATITEELANGMIFESDTVADDLTGYTVTVATDPTI